jgi:hypothetical protein
MDYSNDPRLNFRKQHIENERKPVPSNVARSVGNNSSIPKVEGTKGIEIKTSNPTLSKPISKPNAVATSLKGSKRN